MPIRLTKAVKILIISCFVTFVVQKLVDYYVQSPIPGVSFFDYWLALSPAGFVMSHRIWQLFTYAFLHNDLTHLVLNLMMLAFIGAELEAAWGIRRFLRYYFTCSVAAGVVYLILKAIWWGADGAVSDWGVIVGASGAIYGLLMAYGLLFGERVLLFMMLFPMKAKHFIWILAGIQFMTIFPVFSGRGGSLSSVAHVAGMAAGFIYLWTWASLSVMRKRRAAAASGRPLRKKKRTASQHLKLVINNEKSDDDDDVDTPRTWH
jgi:membrane associated rhomboid family serine protease